MPMATKSHKQESTSAPFCFCLLFVSFCVFRGHTSSALAGAPLRPLDALNAKDVPAAWKPVLGLLARPTDRLLLVGGEELVVEPVTMLLRPGQADDVATV